MVFHLRKPLVGAGVALALLIAANPLPATSQTTEETPAEETPVEEAPVEGDASRPLDPSIEEVQSRRIRTLDELSDAKFTDAQLADQIEQIEREITDKEEELDAVRADLDEKEKEVGRLSKRILEVQNEIDALERVVKNRALELYMGNAAEDSSMSILLSSRNPTEFEIRRMLVQTANSSDREIVDMLADRREEIQESRREAAALRDEVKDAEERVTSELEKMEGDRELVAALRAALDERVTAIRAEVDLLAQEEKALRAILGYPEDPSLDVPTSVQRPESSKGLIWPVDGVLTSVFGMRWGALHAGIDVGAPTGTPVYATKDGTVIFSGTQGGYGNIVIIDHGDGFSTSHAHLSRNVAIQGSRVLQGELIGLVGSTGDSTGPHLHFETRVRGVPYDPLQYLPER